MDEDEIRALKDELDRVREERDALYAEMVAARERMLQGADRERLAILEAVESRRRRGLYARAPGATRPLPLRVIREAFAQARAEVPPRDMRRSKARERLENRRLVGQLAAYGQKITNGKQGSNSYVVWFQPELLARVAELLAAASEQPPDPVDAADYAYHAAERGGV